MAARTGVHSRPARSNREPGAGVLTRARMAARVASGRMFTTLGAERENGGDERREDLGDEARAAGTYKREQPHRRGGPNRGGG